MVRAAVALSACSLCMTVACSALVGTSGLSREDDGAEGDAKDGAPGPGGSSSAQPEAPRGGDAGTPDPVPPGRIACAGATITCEVAVAQCCVTIVGEDSQAVRRVDVIQARCMDPGGPNCGAYSSVGSTFTASLAQTCARSADCGGTTPACCAQPLVGSDPYAKTIGRIACSETSACKSGGRILCASQGDCPPTMTCTPETDPIRSRLYGSFCL